MQINIEIDDLLIQRAMRNTGIQTEQGVVEEGLRLLIQTREQSGIRRLRGKVRLHRPSQHAEANEPD